MDRVKFEKADANRLSLVRTNLQAEARALMKQAGVVFEMGRNFMPEAVQRIGICERLVGFEQVSPGVLRPKPIPDGPVVYRLPAILLPERRFINPRTEEVVPRTVAASMSIEYDNSRSRGLSNELPTEDSLPAPDRVVIGCRAVLLGEPRYDEHYYSEEMLTISNNYVRVYESDWKPVDVPNYSLYPHKTDVAELKDWGALMRYSPGGLTQSMVDFHQRQGDNFTAQLEAVASALTNTGLNPVPAK